MSDWLGVHSDSWFLETHEQWVHISHHVYHVVNEIKKIKKHKNTYM